MASVYSVQYSVEFLEFLHWPAIKSECKDGKIFAKYSILFAHLVFVANLLSYGLSIAAIWTSYVKKTVNTNDKLGLVCDESGASQAVGGWSL